MRYSACLKTQFENFLIMTDDDLTICVTDLEGTDHILPALAGWSVMEIIKDAGLPLKAECGGACACGTCHVYVAPEWSARLPAPLEEETERLENDAFDVRENSRLACQIVMRDDWGGLHVTLTKTDFA